MDDKIVNVNHQHREQRSKSDFIADDIASFVGSWRFISIFAVVVLLWMLFNAIDFFYHFDAYPFTFLNLALGLFSCFSMPLIMMSQNRQSAKDHLAQDNAYKVNIKTELETKRLLRKIDHVRSQQTELADEIKDQIDVIILTLTKLEESVCQFQKGGHHEHSQGKAES